MSKTWKYLKFAITLLIIGYFVYYFYQNRSDFLTVLKTPITDVVLVVSLFGLAMYLNGLFIKEILVSFDKKISTLEAFYISVFSSLGNYLLPMRGGAVLRSVYLKKNFSLSYSYFLSTLYGYYVIVFLVNGVIGLLAISVIGILYNQYSLPLFSFFLVLTIVMILFIVLKVQLRDREISKNTILNKGYRIIRSILEGWKSVKSDSRLLQALILITISIFLVSTLIYYVEFRSLGIQVGVTKIILYSCLSGVSLLISLTPGSLGIREGLFAITSKTLGIGSDQIMQLALLDRGLTVITLILLFLVLFPLLNLMKKQSLLNPQSEVVDDNNFTSDK